MQCWYCRNFMTNSSASILHSHTFVAMWGVFVCFLTTAAGTEEWNDAMVVLWLQTNMCVLWISTSLKVEQPFEWHILFLQVNTETKTSNWRQPSSPHQPSPLPPPPSEWSPIMSRGGNDVPLKSVLNQTQLIPLLSLIISIVDHIPLAGLLTRARAPAKVTLGQAK